MTIFNISVNPVTKSCGNLLAIKITKSLHRSTIDCHVKDLLGKLEDLKNDLIPLLNEDFIINVYIPSNQRKPNGYDKIKHTFQLTHFYNV